jgi:sodium/potassium/calcium exchanger 2
MATQAGGSVTSRAASESRSGPSGSSSAPGNSTAQTATGAKFRHGLLQLMIHTIDPLHDGKVHRTLSANS